MTLENQAADDAALASDIFSLNQGRDSSGTSAPPQEQPKQEAAPPQTEGKEPDPDDDSEKPEDRQRMVPLSELKGERRKYKSRFEEADRQRQTLEAQLAQQRDQFNQLLAHVSRQSPQPAQQHQPQQAEEKTYDAFVEPEQWLDHRLGSFVQQLERQRVEERVADSRDAMIEKHGEGAVNAAVQAAQQMGQGFLGRFTQSRKPFHELMRWHKEHVTRAEVGNDLDAFKRNIAQQVIEAMQKGQPLPFMAQPGQGQQPQAQQVIPPRQAPQQAQPAQQFPGSLSHVQGSNQPVPISDADIAREVFSLKTK